MMALIPLSQCAATPDLTLKKDKQLKTGWEFGWKISTGNGRFGQNEGNEVEKLDTICSLFAKERVHICSNYLETDF